MLLSRNFMSKVPSGILVMSISIFEGTACRRPFGGGIWNDGNI